MAVLPFCATLGYALIGGTHPLRINIAILVFPSVLQHQHKIGEILVSQTLLAGKARSPDSLAPYYCLVIQLHGFRSTGKRNAEQKFSLGVLRIFYRFDNLAEKNRTLRRHVHIQESQYFQFFHHHLAPRTIPVAAFFWKHARTRFHHSEHIGIHIGCTPQASFGIDIHLTPRNRIIAGSRFKQAGSLPSYYCRLVHDTHCPEVEFSDFLYFPCRPDIVLGNGKQREKRNRQSTNKIFIHIFACCKKRPKNRKNFINMTRFLKIVFAACTLMTCVLLAAEASPVRTGQAIVTQPDGSRITVLFEGDEFYKITTTQDGAAVEMCKDGYLRYVVFEDGKRKTTDYIVGRDDTPASIIRAARNIPYQSLKENARELRRRYTDAYFAKKSGYSMPTKTGSTGLIKALVILVEFPDLPFTQGDRDRFNSLLNQEGYSDNGGTGSARDYFKAQYRDLADFQFDVYGPYTAANGYAYYGGNNENGNDRAPAELVAEACTGLDGEIDFSQYDMDGDGVCDFVFMFFAGNDEAQNPALYADNIWSHAYVVDYYNDNLVLDGVRISGYACTSELKVSGNGSVFASIGTFCHEFSHTLGLVDAYDTSYNYDGMPTAEALWGVTSIMDSGSYNNDGNTPPNYNAFEREMLGIAAAKEFATGEQTLPPINASNEFIRIETDVENEYFVIECRKQEGWDAYLPASGLLVYHIDKSQNDAGPSYNYDMNLTAEQRWSYNEVNSYPPHQCADLIEAANTTSIGTETARIFFPGQDNVTGCSSESHEAYRTWSGERIAYQLYDIKMSGDNAVFQILDADALDLPVVVKHSITVAGQNVILSWEASKTDEEATAHVSLSYAGGETISEQEVQTASVSFTDLQADTDFIATIWYEKNGIESEKYEVEFTTFEQRSDFPYIFINRDDLFKGNAIALKLINLENSDCKTEWYLGDYIITTPDRFVIAFEGTRQLKAVVTYPDGRKESIMLEINIPVSEEE